MTIGAWVYAAAVVVLGYLVLGVIPMGLFAFGFVGGLFVWLFRRDTFAFSTIRIPYFVTLMTFVCHKVEERRFGFFPALANLTGIEIVEEMSILGAFLYVAAGAWLLIPVLMRREMQIGYFLAWTFFISMGVTELAHFAFPLFAGGPYTYFPGIVTAVFLVPAGWWGIIRMMAAAK